jgi:hypothetical protein
MDRRDQELLDKQLSKIQAPTSKEGTVSVALLAMFFTGMALGGFVVGYRHGPAQFAANTAAPPIFYNGGATPVLQR